MSNVVYPFADVQLPADTEPQADLLGELEQEPLDLLAHMGRQIALNALEKAIVQCVGALGHGAAITELDAHLSALRVVYKGEE